MRLLLPLLLGLSGLSLHAKEVPPAAPAASAEIEQVLVSPLFGDRYVCSEHAVGELPYPGDDLGQDCMVVSFDAGQDAGFLKLYRTDGLRNEDWYGWDRPVLSPCDCTVAKLRVNPVTNLPAQPSRTPASALLLRRADGTMFTVAHVQGIVVDEGAQLKAGDLIGHVGNNGYARAPHVHIGAWRGKQALQIRWDQRAMRVH